MAYRAQLRVAAMGSTARFAPMAEYRFRSQPLEGQSIEVEPSLAAFLRGRTPAATGRVVWPQSAGEFDFSAYLTPDPPPLELVVFVEAALG